MIMFHIFPMNLLSNLMMSSLLDNLSLLIRVRVLILLNAIFEMYHRGIPELFGC